MEYPMRVYGLNLFEYCLSLWLKWLSWACGLYAVATFIFRHALYPAPIAGAATTTGLLLCFVLLGLAGAGIRQNRAVLDPAVLALLLTGLGLAISGVVYARFDQGIPGLILLLSFLSIVVMRHYALLTRFKPRFFSLRQFVTMTRIADTMIDGDGSETMDPIDIAIAVDHMFSKISSPAAIKEIRLVMFLVEWLLPLIGGRLFPFSDLGTNERRMLVNRVIGSNKLFKNIAKVLKLFACAGYYGSPAGMAQVGYVLYDERPRSIGKSQEPFCYPDPFTNPGGPLYGKI